MRMGVLSRGDRPGKGVAEAKGWPRLENSGVANVAGAWETQRTRKEAAVGGLRNATPQVQSPAPPLQSWGTLSK